MLKMENKKKDKIDNPPLIVTSMEFIKIETTVGILGMEDNSKKNK